MDRFDTALAQCKAMNEYRRIELLAYYRRIRSCCGRSGQNGKAKPFLIERGLPALPSVS